MKVKLVLLLFPILLFGCEFRSKPIVENKANIEKEIKPYFEFDSLEHYSISRDKKFLLELEAKKNKSKTDLGTLKMIFDDSTKQISDSSIFLSLEKLNFKKSIISKTRYQEIAKIFSQKSVKLMEVYACIPLYRDILIFRNKNKIVGIAKICFDCNKKQIIGANVNTDSFGQEGDFEKLDKLLHSF